VTGGLIVRCADDADRARIAAFVAAHPDATPFHQPGWADAIERGCGQRTHWLIAQRGTDVAAVLPLTEVRSPLFGAALVSAGFAVGGGILGEEEAVPALGSAALALAKRRGITGVELRGGAIPMGWAVDDQSYLGFARDLAPDDDAQLLAIPRKQRADVRKSLEAALSVTVGRDQAAADAHYRVYAESVRNLGTPVFPRALMRAALAMMDADVLTVHHDGRPIASVLSLYYQGTVYPYWGGGTQQARTMRANDRMYVALMAHARARGCTRFDFGRSKAGTGAAAFKGNWGFEGKPLRYAYGDASEGQAPRREVNPLDPRYALMVRAWQRLPVPVATLLGPWISRGLG
jgi:FemAB-related protein (PEP-CTERM system-associated)